jgi:hypothetical protein
MLEMWIFKLLSGREPVTTTFSVIMVLREPKAFVQLLAAL